MLATKFKELTLLLRMYRDQSIPKYDDLPTMRLKQSQWIVRFQLTNKTQVKVAPKIYSSYGAYWQDFIPEEINTQTNRYLLYVHGGGLVFYEVDDYSSLLKYWAEKNGIMVTGFGYPKAPEASYELIIKSLSEAIEAKLNSIPESAQIFLAGDSIGAYMALYVALRYFSQRIQRVILISPVLQHSDQFSSFKRYGDGYFLSSEWMAWFHALSKPTSNQQEFFQPFKLSEQELIHLPEIHLYSTEFDVLRDEAFAWKDYLFLNNKEIYHYHFENLPHDFCLYAGYVPEAQAAIDEIAQSFIQIAS